MNQAVSTSPAKRGFDRPLFISVVLLLGFGAVMVYSASTVVAEYQMKNAAHFFVRQVTYAFLGMGVMLVASCVDYHAYKKAVYPLLVFAAIALLLCHTQLGKTVNGASRWIGVGSLTFQPSEAAKLALVLWLSYSLAKKTEKIKTFSVGFLPHIIVPGVIIVLCLVQPDFGTAVVLAVATFSLLFVAGAKLGYILAAAICSAPIAYLLIAGSEYRLKRIMAFLDPLSNRFNDGYQLAQSMFGFGSGGLWGVGLGDGLQKFFFLPEAYNDFIAAIIAEELGAIGIWVLMIVFGIVVVRGVSISIKAPDEFGTFLAFGITVLISSQVLANLGVAMGMIPTKGLNLPFISYGGSSLLVFMLSVGVLLNISKRKIGANVAAQEQRSSKNIRRHSVVPEMGEAV